jgi:hypothetical protein
MSQVELNALTFAGTSQLAARVARRHLTTRVRNKKMKPQQNPEQPHVVTTVRKPYHPPTLRSLGRVNTITLSNGGSGPDGNARKPH